MNGLKQLLVVAGLLLGGCGGGDSSSGNPLPTDTANTPPSAADDSATVITGSDTTIDVLANDSDAQDGVLNGNLLSIVSAPANGSAILESGMVRYTPNSGFTGDDQLSYEIADSDGATATAIVLISVQPLNDTQVIAREVCISDQLPSVDYEHAIEGRTASVSMKAFGIEAGQPVEEWRSRSVVELAAFFEAHTTEQGTFGADHFMLDFEKDWANISIENREAIERSLAAVWSVRPDAEISLFGTPFAPLQNGELHPAYHDSDYLQWIQSLGVGYIPNLYIQASDGVLPSLELIEFVTETTLSIFPPERSLPFMWHKWKNGGNWITNPKIIDTYPDLEPLRVQLQVLERMGFDRVCFWHGDDSEEISEALNILFGE